MLTGKPTDPKVIAKIRDDGMSVTDASATYGFSSKTIYTWLKVLYRD